MTELLDLQQVEQLILDQKAMYSQTITHVFQKLRKLISSLETKVTEHLEKDFKAAHKSCTSLAACLDLTKQ